MGRRLEYANQCRDGNALHLLWIVMVLALARNVAHDHPLLDILGSIAVLSVRLSHALEVQVMDGIAGRNSCGNSGRLDRTSGEESAWLMRRSWGNRIVICGGVLLGLGILGLWIHSAFVALRVSVFVRQVFAFQFTSSFGSIECVSLWPLAGISTDLWATYWDNGGADYFHQQGWTYLPEVVFRRPLCGRIVPNGRMPNQRGLTYLVIPDWMILLLVMLAVLWAWQRGRPGVRPGYCRSCGYDLRGNVSGVCPECGISCRSG